MAHPLYRNCSMVFTFELTDGDTGLPVADATVTFSLLDAALDEAVVLAATTMTNMTGGIYKYTLSSTLLQNYNYGHPFISQIEATASSRQLRLKKRYVLKEYTGGE